MTDPLWCQALDPDAMLAFVAPRFTPRRWRLFAAALLRRRWDVLPPGPFQEAVDWLERHADRPDPVAAAEWPRKISDAIAAETEAAEGVMRDILRAAGPDVEAQSTLDDAVDATPALPLFLAASRYAGLAVAAGGRHVDFTAEAVRHLFTPPGREAIDYIFDRIETAVSMRADANRTANTALRLKLQADEMTDRTTAKTRRIEESKAVEMVRRQEEKDAERAGGEFGPDEDTLARNWQKAVGRFLHELCGRPALDLAFDPKWRTADVVELARVIDAGRAFEKMPILADALLDADCDSEAVLRHLRGTETFTKEKPTHLRGCWVLDLILRPDDALFTGVLPPDDEPPKPKAKKRKGAP